MKSRMAAFCGIPEGSVGYILADMFVCLTGFVSICKIYIGLEDLFVIGIPDNDPPGALAYIGVLQWQVRHERSGHSPLDFIHLFSRTHFPEPRHLPVTI